MILNVHIFTTNPVLEFQSWILKYMVYLTNYEGVNAIEISLFVKMLLSLIGFFTDLKDSLIFLLM